MAESPFVLVPPGAPDLVPFVHVVIEGSPKAAPRPRARIIPAVPLGVALGRLRRAESFRDILSIVRPHIYTPTPAGVWGAGAKRALLEARRVQCRAQPIVYGMNDPIEVFLLVVFELPKTKRRKREPPLRAWQTSRGSGDFDNLAKPICDAATGILWPDDCQVVRATVEKVVGSQDEPPRIELLARRLVDSPEDTIFSAVRSGRAWCAAPGARLLEEE